MEKKRPDRPRKSSEAAQKAPTKPAKAKKKAVWTPERRKLMADLVRARNLKRAKAKKAAEQ